MDGGIFAQMVMYVQCDLIPFPPAEGRAGYAAIHGRNGLGFTGNGACQWADVQVKNRAGTCWHGGCKKSVGPGARHGAKACQGGKGAGASYKLTARNTSSTIGGRSGHGMGPFCMVCVRQITGLIGRSL
ncbi:hypothetical protein AA0483_0372 [Acetobacter syzygii NRIC 0483]|nr:hypothetical protein AA0483_0372 [Acetobacter syzygii NRIC 0483]